MFVMILTIVLCLALGYFLILKIKQEGLRPAGKKQSYYLVESEESKFSYVKFRDTIIILFAVAFLSRIFIFIFAWIISMNLFDERTGFFSSFHTLWFRWDSRHFAGIAEYGYRLNHALETQIAFYPLYPFLIRITAFVGRLFGGTAKYFDVSFVYYYSGVFVSLIFFSGAVYFLWRIVLQRYNKVMAIRAVKYLIIIPYGFFFAMVYTESFFLCMVLASAFAMQNKKWLLAGAAGFAAALTRNQGVLLIVPLLISAIPYLFTKTKGLHQRWIKIVAAALMVFGGIGVYLLVNWYVAGDPFHFLYHQKNNWGNEFGFFPQVVSGQFDKVLTHHSTRLAFSTFLPSFFVFFSVLALVFVTRKDLPLPWIVFCLVFLIISFSPTSLLSSQRYMLGAFPIYIALAVLASKKRIYEYLFDIGLAGFFVYTLLGFLFKSVF